MFHRYRKPREETQETTMDLQTKHRYRKPGEETQEATMDLQKKPENTPFESTTTINNHSHFQTMIE